MWIEDDIVISAVADALENGVLFLTDRTSDSDEVVGRASRLTMQNLRKYGSFTSVDARRFILASDNPWRLRFRSGGWVFFCPEREAKPGDDVGNPVYVYVRDGKGRYERLSYNTWKARFSTPEAEAEEDFVSVPKSAWEHLVNDDLGDYDAK